MIVAPGVNHAYRAVGPNAFTVVNTRIALDHPLISAARSLPFRAIDDRILAFTRLARLEIESGGTRDPLLAATLARYLIRRLHPGGFETPACHGEAGASYLAERIKAFVDAHWNEPLSIERIAASVAVSPNYAARVFRTSFGRSIVAYRNQTRIDRARQMLESSQKSVSEIAAACGFASLAYFTRTYRRSVGMTPRETRGFRS